MYDGVLPIAPLPTCLFLKGTQRGQPDDGKYLYNKAVLKQPSSMRSSHTNVKVLLPAHTVFRAVDTLTLRTALAAILAGTTNYSLCEEPFEKWPTRGLRKSLSGKTASSSEARGSARVEFVRERTNHW